MSFDRTSESRPERVGPYRIEKQIGVGGMGAVFRARDERLHRSVALKRVRMARSATSPRLTHEARTIAQISHPNIVQVYDLLTHGGCQWIVMELVDGLTLRQILQNQTLKVEQVVDYCQGITKGLAAAHARGIVHRDLKTENVMITNEGQAKILDFGISTLPLPGTAQRGTVHLQGTARAMAPEQAMRQPTNHRSDLFSLGVLLYECLSGESPFAQDVDDIYKTLWRVCTYCPPALSNIRPTVPEGLSNLVERLLEKEAADRPESAEDVLLALQRSEETSPKKMRILFVDDEPDVEAMTRQWFRYRGDDERFEPFFAADGVEALAMLHNDPKLQVVFTDLRMPKMDGIRLLAEISKLERTCISVVISAFDDIANIRSAMNLGAFDFLTKPFGFEDFKTTLHKAAHQAATLHESRRLRAENRLLDERNKAFRLAFSRYLQGDPDFGRVFEPLVRQAQTSDDRLLTLLSLEVEGFSRLPTKLSARQLLDLSFEFLSDVIALVQRYHGEILGFEAGRFSIGFGLDMTREADGKRAQQCANMLCQRIESLSLASREYGGPSLAAKCVIDVGSVTIDDRSGTLSGDGPERAARFLDTCTADQILILTTIDAAEFSEQALV